MSKRKDLLLEPFRRFAKTKITHKVAIIAFLLVTLVVIIASWQEAEGDLVITLDGEEHVLQVDKCNFVEGGDDEGFIFSSSDDDDYELRLPAFEVKIGDKGKWGLQIANAVTIHGPDGKEVSFQKNQCATWVTNIQLGYDDNDVWEWATTKGLISLRCGDTENGVNARIEMDGCD